MSLESTSEIIQGALPSILRLPLSFKETPDTHQMVHMTPVIAVGTRVLKGQLIATNHKTAYLHAPTSGTIRKIGSFLVGYTTEFSLTSYLNVTYRQQSTDCIELVPDEKEETIEYTPIDWQQCSSTELYQKIVQSGISCLSRYCVNPAEIYSIPNLQTFIINATECEPYIHTANALTSKQAAMIVEGLAMIAKVFSVKNLWIVTHEKQALTQKSLRQAIAQFSTYFDTQPQMVTVPAKYPLGHPSILLQQLTGIKITHQTDKQEMNVACIEPSMLIAIQRAVITGQPFLSRLVYFTGQALLKPGHYETLIGTPLHEVLDQAALKPHKLYRLIMGSAMTGLSIEDASLPITKTTTTIIAATEAEMPIIPKEQPCIRCGHCESVCPVHLLPDELYRMTKAKRVEEALNYRLMDCIECGACAAVCPSYIPLVGYFQWAKQDIQQTQITQCEKDQARFRFEQRTQRVEKEKTLKELQRQERLQAAIIKRTENATSEISVKSQEEPLQIVTQNTPTQTIVTRPSVTTPSEACVPLTPNSALRPTEILTNTPPLTTEQLKNNYLKIRKIYQATEKALEFSKKTGKSAEDIAQATAQLNKLQLRMQEAQTAIVQAEKAENQIEPK